ncbi:eukaryotic-like serine/threonine-protein kinase [Pelolinea submarina]|nr:eukaryotic-like serine/threonine-protein kinase [Pelolinea submarina]
MAVIYLAQDLLLERSVAMKILRRDFSDNQEFQNRFRAEARASARLSHPNIVTTYDFGYDADRLYIVFELVQGKDLKSILAEQAPLPMAQALDYLRQAGRGLGYAHENGIVHCDVKTQNMLVSDLGILKITDFGIARAMDSISRDERSDVVWGSPYYLSPEQARGLPPSPATDVYSLGVIAYEMFAGKLPFDAEDSIELARKHREDSPIPPKELNPEISEDLNAFILKALSKKPEERFSDGNIFVKALNSIGITRNRPAESIKERLHEGKAVNKNQKAAAALPVKQKPKVSRKYDWRTILLSFLALIVAGGLIPFWIYVLFSLNK